MHSTEVCSAPNWESLVELRIICSTTLLSLSYRIHCSLRTLWELYTDFWVISIAIKFKSHSAISFILHYSQSVKFNSLHLNLRTSV